MHRVWLFCVSLASLLFGISGERCQDGIVVNGFCKECNNGASPNKDNSRCEGCPSQFTGLYCHVHRCHGNGDYDVNTSSCICNSQAVFGENCAHRCDHDSTVNSEQDGCDCRKDLPYSGRLCEIHQNLHTCRGRGTYSVVDGSCDCSLVSESFGLYCEYVCENGGTVNRNKDGCDCGEGSHFVGLTCKSHKCNNNGILQQDNTTCTCNPGWTGDKCDGGTNAAQCRYMGTFFEASGACECNDHRSGDTCELTCTGNGNIEGNICACIREYEGSECAFHKCNNHGILQQDNTTCNCNPGWTGDRCDGVTNAPQCGHMGTFFEASGTCECNARATTTSDGSCECIETAEASAGACVCRTGFNSVHCEIFLCLNSGIRELNTEGEHRCTCRPGYSGYACQYVNDLRKAFDRLKASPHEGVRDLVEWMGTRPFEFMNISYGEGYTLVVNRDFLLSDVQHMSEGDANHFMKSFILSIPYTVDRIRRSLVANGGEVQARQMDGRIIGFSYDEAQNILLNNIKVVDISNPENIGTKITILETYGYINVPIAAAVTTTEKASSAQSLTIASIAVSVFSAFLF